MFTDLEDVVPLLKTNVASNVPSGRVVPALSHCSTRGDAKIGDTFAVAPCNGVWMNPVGLILPTTSSLALTLCTRKV
jgi:hypothetical protein